MQSTTITKLATALVAVQGEMPALKKTANNPFFKSKYVDLATVMENILPILSKHGIALTQFVSNIDGQSALTTTLVHTSGEYMSAQMPLLLPKNDPQGQGSAITYARRYGAMAALGIVADEDDDGNKATQATQTNGTYQHEKVSPDKRMAQYGKHEPLITAKSELVKAFYSKGITKPEEMKTVVEVAIGKPDVETVEEAESVMATL
jgi:hypothetical protein